MPLARRVAAIQPSETLAITAKAKAMRAAGKSVINFAAGEPDFDTPAHITEAAKRAIDEGKTKYTPSSGLPELREAVVRRLREDRALAQPLLGELPAACADDGRHTQNIGDD